MVVAIDGSPNVVLLGSGTDPLTGFETPTEIGTETVQHQQAIEARSCRQLLVTVHAHHICQ